MLIYIIGHYSGLRSTQYSVYMTHAYIIILYIKAIEHYHTNINMGVIYILVYTQRIHYV